MSKRGSKRTVTPSTRVLQTRTLTSGVVDNLQTNGATIAPMPGQEAVDAEVDGENSVAVLMAAAEDLLRDISPLTRTSAHPSPAYSVNNILEAAMRDFPDIPDDVGPPPASILVLSRPRLTASQKGKGRQVGTPSQEGGPVPSAKAGPSATSRGFDQPQVVPVPSAKAGPSATFQECKQTRPEHKTDEWDRIHPGSKCRQRPQTYQKWGCTWPLPPPLSTTTQPSMSNRTRPSLASSFTSAVARHSVWTTPAMQVALDLLQEVEDLQSMRQHQPAGSNFDPAVAILFSHNGRALVARDHHAVPLYDSTIINLPWECFVRAEGTLEFSVPPHKAASEELVKTYDKWLGLTIQMTQGLKDDLDLGDGI
ncbi:hypothetical protein EV421DRAFT_1927141 [Armillaria borealis]|uniref:Uncharacterized protein n=1 Tax=Armillaria borealis TaxID=47425 RepID=A0AA39IXC3_9AGAR|nr:hypothetical protein EV421DRAFT_1927141 [Armillaria borealis]